MSYARQPTTAERLTKISLRALDEHMAEASKKLGTRWHGTKKSISKEISSIYSSRFGAGRWSLASAKHNGTLLHMDVAANTLLRQFYRAATKELGEHLTAIYKESLLRHAWVLDQTTPESVRIHVPARRNMEAAYAGPDAQVKWYDRMDQWLAAYRSVLNQNLTLGSMNESSLESAAGEPDATRVGSPQTRMGDVLDRIAQTELWAAVMAAEDDVVAANERLGLTEVWQTRGALDVCEDCVANEGLRPEETDGYIPLHPNCRCYWRMVPKTFAELLASGDQADKDLAYEMDARGLVPDSLVVRGPDGELAAKAIVDFKQWVEGRHQTVGGGI